MFRRALSKFEYGHNPIYYSIFIRVQHVADTENPSVQHLPVFRMWEGSGDSQLITYAHFFKALSPIFHMRWANVALGPV